ncbi:MAG: hypothetical protein Unbinned3891contig1000_24 [Prokaryotic dsDNA virus sp.]|nr:MAG: hypothetical protein Unbinned3891contig1000_24 [Prokaryotic dsDNA virus sp.]|tara:strand:- start:10771 stop:10947 length:177 start_codon:yes stop_codon:yes gene_type:complete
MRMYFSGQQAFEGSPELLVRKKKPSIMLTYWEIHKTANGACRQRLDAYVERKQRQKTK